MEPSDTLTLFATLLTLLALGYLVLRNTTSGRILPFPPGPRPLPVLGNLFDIPLVDEYKVYTKWAAKYGDVIHVSALGKRIVVVNSTDAANDLLDGRSIIYSDRPYLPMVHDTDLVDVNWSFAVKRYGPEWRRQRRLFIHHLGPAASQPPFLDAQKASADTLLRSLLRAPNDFVVHLKHASAEATLLITYGYHMRSMDDPLVAIVKHAMETSSDATNPTRFLVNVFPWLKYVPAWFPGSGFKTFATSGREAGRRHVEVPFEYARQRIDEGTASPSFVTSALTHASPDDLIIDIKHVAATMYGGGAETTSSTMHCCILALVLNPVVQKFAHTELDSVLGSVTSSSFRLPTFADRSDLPYIDAIVKETLRWFPVGPLGIAHAVTEDDIYRNWRIPKGTIVIANAWSMLHDEKTYPDPQAFRPERFLGEDPAPHPELHGCFGFGRRECPGRHLAEAALWIQIASLLAVFTFLPAKDKDGREIDIDYARESPPHFILHPQDFPCRIVPRSKEAEARVRETNPESY